MERAVTFIPILFRIPHLNLPFRELLPLQILVLGNHRLLPLSRLTDLDLLFSFPSFGKFQVLLCVWAQSLVLVTSPPHSPSGMLQGAISEPALRLILCPALANLQLWITWITGFSSLLLLPGCQALWNKGCRYSLRGVSLRTHLLRRVLGENPPKQPEISWLQTCNYLQ